MESNGTEKVYRRLQFKKKQVQNSYLINRITDLNNEWRQFLNAYTSF